MNCPSLLSAISWYFGWKQIFLLSWLIWKILARARLGYFVQTSWACLAKSKAFAAVFFCQNRFLFASFKPWADKKGLCFYSWPYDSPPLGVREEKTFMFQQKSPDFQKIINTFKSYQRQLYKRIHEHSYIKENLEPGVPISADFQIACEWLDLAPHTPPPPPASQQTLHHNGIHGHTVKTRWTREGPGARTFMRIRLVWSSLVWSGLVQMTKQALENLA